MISVIIPTFNEAEHLPRTLEKIRANPGEHEIVVVDGGSRDKTLEIAKAMGVKVVCSGKGRSLQLNAGAKAATGSIFFFLHADTQLNPFSLAQIEEALKNERIVGGGFARRFDSDSCFLHGTCALATLRGSWFGIFLGDQGMFVRRDVFEALGGFKRMTAFEDVDFSRRLARLGQTATLRPAVISSARRFAKRGPFLTTCLDFWLTCKYITGVDDFSAGCVNAK